MRFTLNSPYVISETIDGETIIIHLGTGLYYSLENGDGVWDAIMGCTSTEEVVATLEGRYDASPREIESAVHNLVRQLADEDLVTVTVDDDALAPASVKSGVTPIERAPFRAPVLTKYSDMQDLVLLDPVHEVSDAGWPQTQAQAHGA